MPRTNRKKHANSKKRTQKHMPGRQFDYVKKGRLAYEGKSARKELKRIKKYANELDHRHRNHDDLPEWVQKKIVLASEYMGSVYHYMDFKMAEHKNH